MSTTVLPAPTISSEACAVGPAGSDGCRACVDTCPDGAINVRQRPDGAQVHGDERRAKAGFNVNDAMRRNDDVLDDMVDNAGGGTVFLDSRVKLEKV